MIIYRNLLDNTLFEGDGIDSMAFEGELGETLASIEESLGSFNKELESATEGGLNNCFGTCESIAKTGKVDPYGAQGAGFLFDDFLKNETSNTYSPETLDIIRYSYTTNDRNQASHGSIFLLKNEKGTQIFTKNGIDNAAFYEIMYENETIKNGKTVPGLLQLHPTYGEKAGVTREDGTQDDSPYYKSKN